MYPIKLKPALKDYFWGGESFRSALRLNGNAMVGGVSVKAGECIFLAANMGKVEIKKNAEFIVSGV